MDPRLSVLVLVIGLGAAAYPTLAAEPAPPQLRAYTIEVVAVPCTLVADGVCIAYNGVVPGPTLEVNLGDTIEITLVNRIAETLPARTPENAALVERLSAAPVSWHVHGTAVAPDMDGVAAHPGTNLVASVAEPGGSFTYRTRAAYAGPWHYHDHVLGLDGDEGVERGLFGGLVVRSGAALRPDAVVDLHTLNDGPRGGWANLSAATTDSFELLVVGLEDFIWSVELKDPSGAVVGTVVSAPGLSESILVEDAQPGAYTWRMTGAGTKTGRVVIS